MSMRICALNSAGSPPLIELILSMIEELTDPERAAIQAEVERLRVEHHDLEAAIDALLMVGAVDQLQIQRLKKRKLLLRDRVNFLEDKLNPDIIA
jgi:hypothetical protein